MFHFLATTNIVHQQMTEAVGTTTDWLVKYAGPFLQNVLISAVMILVGAYVIRMLVFSLRKAIQRSGRASALLESFFCNAFKKTLWLILLMSVIQKLGVNIAPLLAGAGVLGIVIGFASQESLANLAAGIMIALNQPFKVGDFVSAGGADGFVDDLNMMATTLLTPDYKRITIPNKVIWATPISNYYAMDRRRVEITVNIPYGSNIDKAKQVALDTVRANPLVLADPAPIAEVMTLGIHSINLIIRPWSKPSDYFKVVWSATAAINDAFVKNGIKIAVPEQVIRLQGDPALLATRDGDRT
jgi:small conductance mechanosensitive channel